MKRQWFVSFSIKHNESGEYGFGSTYMSGEDMNMNLPIENVAATEWLSKKYDGNVVIINFIETNPPKSKEESQQSTPNTAHSEISAFIERTLSALDHGCGPHIRDFIKDLQKLQNAS